MGDRPKKKPGFGHAARLICIVIPLIVLLASNLGIMFYFLINMKLALPTTHAASLLRSDLMRLHHQLHDFRMGKGNQKEIEELQEKVKTYLYALRDGNKALRIRESPGKLEEPGYQNLRWNWNQHIHGYEDICKPWILQILNAPTAGEREEAFSRYNSESEALLVDVDRTVTMTREHFLIKPFTTFSRFAQGLFIASIVLAGVTFYLIRQFVRRPPGAVMENVEEVARGRWGKTLEAKTRGELDRQAQSFSTLSMELEKTIKALEREKLELEEANKRLQESRYQDFRTGLYNYYYFQETLKAEYLRASRHAVPLSLIMLDVDHFKHINDTLGHPFGDFVLEEMGKRIKESIRSTDIAYRYGGEEFTILLPHTDYEGAQRVGQKVKDALCGQVFKKDDSSCNVTVTLGISSMEEPGIREAVNLVTLADEALLEGKSRGGNCVVLASHTRRRPEIDATILEDYRRRLATTEKNLKRAYMDATTALLRAMESKDDYTVVHSYLVATYVWHFAGVLNLTSEERDVIKNAALLHDLGKISIPGLILRKEGALTGEEISIIRQHPYYSASIIKGIKFLESEFPIILYHHERWDGQGYPSGLRGKDTPLGARILGLADAYEAITSARPYRKARSSEEASKILRAEAGHQFDPELVEPFIQTIREFLSTTRRVYISQLDKIVEIGS